MNIKIFKRVSTIALVACMFSLAVPLTALAATTPSLGTANTFGLLSDLFQHNASTTITGVVGNVLGVLGHSSKAGAGIITVTNGIEELDASAAWTVAGIAQGTALTNLNNQYLLSCRNIGETGNLDAIVIDGGTPGHFPPGCYYRAGAMNIVDGGTVNLDGAGTYIFKSTGGAVTTGANTEVKLNDGASACDVFWTPVGATTLGANSTFKGTVLDAAGITIGDTVTWEGRALAYGGTVTSNGSIDAINTITVPDCSNPASLTVTKTVVNTGGGSKVVADFPLSVGATSVISGVLTNFSAGAYVITETTNSEYTQTFSDSCSSGNITLASNQDYTCTITNTYIPPAHHSGGGTSIIYGCKDPLATNYNYFSASNPALCKYATTIVAPVVVATTTTTVMTTPKLPNAGLYPRDENAPWYTTAIFLLLQDLRFF
jgi:hypothetical protein